MAEIWGAAIAVVGAAGAGYEASQGAKSAANTQAGAANSATQEQQREFNVNQQNQQPYLQTGTAALNQLARLYGLPMYNSATNGSTNASGAATGGAPTGVSVQPGGAVLASGNGATIPGGSLPGASTGGSMDLSSFLNSPDYQFTLNQGLGAVKANAAATGNLASGNTLAALNNYAQGAASTQLNNYTNRLAGIAGVGQTAANQLGAQGTQNAAIIGQNTIAAGNARASGIAGSNNAWGNALGTVGGVGYNYFNQPSYAPGGGAVGANVMPQYTGQWDYGATQGYLGSGSSYSDRRLKSDIARIGTLESGLPVYRFRYRGSSQLHIGVMADEAAHLFPEAVQQDSAGYSLVNYSKLR